MRPMECGTKEFCHPQIPRYFPCYVMCVCTPAISRWATPIKINEPGGIYSHPVPHCYCYLAQGMTACFHTGSTC